MRTSLSPDQTADPVLAGVAHNLRTCVHCGICTATCPTYVLLGDERDGPRGRIVMMQRMLESGGVPGTETVRHIDRCLSCLGCRSACPSGVDYARLVDAARAHIHAHYRRPLTDRLLRWAVLNVLTRPALADGALRLARLVAPVASRLPGRIGAAARKAVALPRARRPVGDLPDEAAATRRIALLRGCVQQALAPAIDQAAARVLARRGIALHALDERLCCGALAHHLGHRDEAKQAARRVIAAFEAGEAKDGVLITATGCAAHLADYAHLLADEPEWRQRAEGFAAKLADFAELATPRKARAPRALSIAHHIPCSLQHGLRHGDNGRTALEAAGYALSDVPEGHLCCGSAGSYSLLQPGIAGALRERKLRNIASLGADAVAAANIGCITHLAGPDAPPVLHPAELLDWAEGGPEPAGLKMASAAQQNG